MMSENKDLGRSADADGLSQAEPVPVSSVPASIPSADDLRELQMKADFYHEVCGAAREAAKHAFGGNCTFIDDDITMLCHFACWALDQGYRGEITDERTLRNIAQAIEARSGETAGLDPKDESAVAEGHAPEESPHAH